MTIMDSPEVPSPRREALALPNSTYQGIRLLFERGIEAQFLDVGGIGRVLNRFKRASVMAILLWFVTAIIWGPLLLVGIGFVLAPLILIGGWFFFFLRPDAEGIASWQQLADGQAEQAESAYVATLQELFNVRYVQAAGVHPDYGPPDAKGRWLMRIRLGSYTMFVAIVPFGRDLHVSWVMVLERSGIDAIREFFKFFGKTWKAKEVEAASAKALRDVVHNSLANGVWRVASGERLTLARLQEEWRVPAGPSSGPGDITFTQTPMVAKPASASLPSPTPDPLAGEGTA